MRASGLIAAVGTATALTVGAPAPALAANLPMPDRGKTVEILAGVGWLEQDPEDASGRPGNVHRVALGLSTNGQNSDVFAGLLIDYDCAPGDLPSEEGADCRQLVHYEAATAAIRFDFDRRAGTAHVTGTVTFSDVLAEEPEQLTLPVDLHWTDEGRPVRTFSHHVDLSSVPKQVIRTRTLGWPAVQVTGAVGPLVVGDEPGEIEFRQLSHEEVRIVIWRRPSGEPSADGGGMG